MRIAVTGSIATDHLMVFPGRFADQLIADQLAHVSLSFLVDDLEVRRGGVAANIAFGLGSLGLDPLLVGAVGSDFATYEVWLKEHGVDTGAVRVSDERQTARFSCITDRDDNQIAAFYAGAMAEAREIDLTAEAARAGGVGFVLVAPDDPAAMLRHTAACRTLGVPFAADPPSSSPASPVTRCANWSTAPGGCSPTSTRRRSCWNAPPGTATTCWAASAAGSPRSARAASASRAPVPPP